MQRDKNTKKPVVQTVFSFKNVDYKVNRNPESIEQLTDAIVNLMRSIKIRIEEYEYHLTYYPQAMEASGQVITNDPDYREAISFAWQEPIDMTVIIKFVIHDEEVKGDKTQHLISFYHIAKSPDKAGSQLGDSSTNLAIKSMSHHKTSSSNNLRKMSSKNKSLVDDSNVSSNFSEN